MLTGLPSRIAQPQALRRSAKATSSVRVYASSSNQLNDAAPQLGRREALALAAALTAAAALPAGQASAFDLSALFGPKEVYVDPAPEGFKTLADETLAYTFIYPVAGGLNLTFSRRPEKYSSAAPLSADARQRIVCELVDLTKSITISIAVGPPSGILRDRSAADWRPKEVAQAVLIDKSTARVSTGQRVALNSIESVKEEDREGVKYIIYEHVSQGSPSNLSPGAKETFRRAISATVVRPGLDGTPYLYTMNISAPDPLWDNLRPGFEQSLASFHLTQPGRDFISPERDPWAFW